MSAERIKPPKPSSGASDLGALVRGSYAFAALNTTNPFRICFKSFKPYKSVIEYELLPYHRSGESKYSFLGRVYEMEDFKSPTEESLAHLRAIIDEAFASSNEA